MNLLVNIICIDKRDLIFNNAELKWWTLKYGNAEGKKVTLNFAHVPNSEF